MKVAASFLSNTLFNFIIGLLLAKFLGPEDYGRFAVAVGIAVMVQTVAFDWARLAAARFSSERVRREEPELRATLDVSLAAIILLLVLVTAGVLLSGLTLPMSSGLAGLAVGTAVVNGLFDYHTALVRAQFLDGVYARLIIGKNILSMILTVGGAYWFGSAPVALLGVTLSMAGAMLSVRHRLADPAARPRLARGALAGTLFRYGLPVVLANLFYQSIPLADRLLIARSHGLAESGQFSFAYDIGIRLVAAIGSMLDVLLFQIAVRADEIHGTAQGKRQIGRNIGIVVAVLLPACAGCWLVLPSFEILVVPAQFKGAFSHYLGLLLPGLFCYGLIFFALHPLFQIARTTAPLVAAAVGASLVNILCLAVLPIATDTAVFAVAQGLSLALAVLALVIGASAAKPVWPPVRDLVGSLAATAVMALLVGRITMIEPGPALLLLQGAAGAAVYAACAFTIDLCGIRGMAGAWRRSRAQ